jgi:topoisomerase-4 subunit B
VKNERHQDTTLFITEGDSASGSITKSRNVELQAVFSLRGKPLNCYGLTKKVVYENEEFNLLQHALDIEDGIENLRYNQIVIATDADVDGMHIRLLMLTFFLQFFPDLVRNGHLFILETPLFRVRNKKQTIYCYTDEERQRAIAKLGPSRKSPGSRAGRNLAGRVRQVHRRRHQAQAGDHAQGYVHPGAAELLHGQEHPRPPAVHRR